MTRTPSESSPGGSSGQPTPRPQRKNLMLSASIGCGSTQAAVRIRNLSETGAMLDGAVLPDPGTRMVLRRAEIEIGATVIWREGGRCGVHFDTVAASVDEWVTGKRPATFNGAQGQARVDAIQSAVRSGAALIAEPASTTPKPSDRALDQRLSEEIVHVQRLIDTLGEALVEDPEMLQRHMRVLQNLDRASQILEHLGTVLAADDRAAAAQGVAMQDLRERLLRDL
ncbi:PilZ domain-containing protein [Sphingomonas sp. HF-S4]|uniref:PilZ domain-containing protein n=1 Tax=Sphingomonas agrestis TaxID=3080540 RepID=A0ABU3Y2Z3_9SPHN|nr:PilZ domain-containing protein [Sphingomonas sp. HF-S4]MDV3455746.1 PilZ domain-containing protein [Sphingomonas sp. HF-S4]